MIQFYFVVSAKDTQEEIRNGWYSVWSIERAKNLNRLFYNPLDPWAYAIRNFKRNGQIYMAEDDFYKLCDRLGLGYVRTDSGHQDWIRKCKQFNGR